MSTTIMGAVWPLDMPGVAKSVLVSLADNANDNGYCWPSIDTICSRTCFGRSAVIDAIKWLESNGHLEADRCNGRHSKYRVLHGLEAFTNLTNQSARQTGAPAGPVRQTDRTSPPAGPDQSASRTLTIKNHQEPSLKKRTAHAPASVPRPENVDPKVWEAFLVLRAKLRAPVTEIAMQGLEREAAKAGLSVEAAIRECCERSWRGFKAEWVAPLGSAAKPLTAKQKRDAEIDRAITAGVTKGRRAAVSFDEVFDV